MKNIAACYSEHAVKVSDSYCSGPLNKSYISPKSIPSTQNHVTYTYKSNISNQKRLFITITWSSKLIYQGFFIKISEKMSKPSNSQNGFHQITKIHGSKSLLLDSKHTSMVDIYWDLSKARFEAAGPTPIEGFYLVIILVDSQIAFVLGDMKECNAVENLVKEMIMPKITLISQCEQFRGQWNNQINSKARFSDYGIEHDIMIKCGPEDDGPRNPVLSVYVDDKRVVRVKKLQWNFRGNQVIFVDNLLVDVMWDVFGWYLDQNAGLIGEGELYRPNGPTRLESGLNRTVNTKYNEKIKGGCGLFMFRTRSGLDSRLWLIEEEKKLTDKNDDKPHFSLLICASSKNPG